MLMIIRGRVVSSICTSFCKFQVCSKIENFFKEEVSYEIPTKARSFDSQATLATVKISNCSGINSDKINVKKTINSTTYQNTSNRQSIRGKSFELIFWNPQPTGNSK